ncbi:hypothetical protein CVT24_001892 [Panaeolus cyanescens]|uniref:Uncharacterized protein n=1 Tax=Panaeolus cyanescens TaxID=181874 RepID=A0A409YET3_9AGAR|nr:hypothetical protein CVT24_001892 [Panaeolus cyanescens]
MKPTVPGYRSSKFRFQSEGETHTVVCKVTTVPQELQTFTIKANLNPTMQFKLTNLINVILMITSATAIVGAVAVPEANVLERRCLPLNAICTGALQCCNFPTVGCYGPPGLNSIKRCKVSGSG